MIDTNKLKDLKLLRSGFKQFLDTNYNHLSYKNVICSEAFYIFRENLEMEPSEILISDDGIKEYREKLMEHFTYLGRKNPKSDSYTYCRAIKLLGEYISKEDDKIMIQTTKTKETNKKIRRKGNRSDIPVPSKVEVVKYLELWKMLDNYKSQESAIDKLFHVTYPLNCMMDDVLVKVSTLNDFYSTNIFAV